MESEAIDYELKTTPSAIKSIWEIEKAKDMNFWVQVIQIKNFDNENAKKNIRMRYANTIWTI